jgi:hypothetical protein
MSFGPQNMTFPNWLVEQISRDIQEGKEYPEFWAARPDWQEHDESSTQTDEQKEKAAQA